MEIISGKSRVLRPGMKNQKRAHAKPVGQARRRLDAPQRRGRCLTAVLEGPENDETRCHRNAYAHCHAENLAQLFGLGIPQRAYLVLHHVEQDLQEIRSEHQPPGPEAEAGTRSMGKERQQCREKV